MKDQNLQVKSDKKVAYAGFWRRFLASSVDGFVILIISISIQMSLGLDPFAYADPEKLATQAQMSSSVWQSLISTVGVFIYYVLFWVHFDGATPGKKLLAIKIVKDNNKPLNYPVAAVRWIGNFASLMTFFLFGFGYLMVLWDKKKQSLHDKIAGTIVVKTGAKPRLVWAWIITLSMMITILGFMLAGFLSAYQYASQKTQIVGRSAIEAKNEMSKEAKVHFDRSMKLFEDLRALSTEDQSNMTSTQKREMTARYAKINDENIAELKAALILEPDNQAIWYELGNAYTWISTKGTLEDSLSAYKKAEELEPNNVVYINGVGDALINLDRFEDAVLQFQKTLRLTDNSGYANLSIAGAYAKLGIVESAQEHYQTAIEIFTKQNSKGQFDDEILRARKGLAEVQK